MYESARKASLLSLAVLAMAAAGDAWAATVSLPDPTSTIDGLPVASKHDDFYTYSAKLLDQWQDAGFLPVATYGDWGTYIQGVGTGTLDLLVTTRAVGADNENVGADLDPVDPGPGGDFNFEKPTVNSQDAEIDLWWGQNDQLNDGQDSPALEHSPVTVGALLAYMTATFGPDATIPVFTFDLSQQGSGNSLNLYVVGRVALLDPETRQIMAFWAFDNIDNAIWDCPGAPGVGDTMSGGTYNCNDAGGADTNELWWVNAFGERTFDGIVNDYTVDNNTGSGSTDFVIYAPGMDLRKYKKNWIFMTEVHYIGANDGPEELYLTGAIATNDTPVPATLPLLGGGLLALGALHRLQQLRRAKGVSADCRVSS